MPKRLNKNYYYVVRIAGFAHVLGTHWNNLHFFKINQSINRVYLEKLTRRLKLKEYVIIQLSVYFNCKKTPATITYYNKTKIYRWADTKNYHPYNLSLPWQPRDVERCCVKLIWSSFINHSITISSSTWNSKFCQPNAGGYWLVLEGFMPFNGVRLTWPISRDAIWNGLYTEQTSYQIIKYFFLKRERESNKF